MSSRERFEAWYWQEISANQDFMPVCWEAWQARDAEVSKLVEALREARAGIEAMSFGDPVPGSWRDRVDALLREYPETP